MVRTRRLTLADIPGLEVVIAVPTSTIGTQDRGTLQQITAAAAEGVRIVPHGVQHIRLASYDEDRLLPTPHAGTYQLAPHDDSVLSENEVLYQLVESKEILSAFEPDEFRVSPTVATTPPQSR